MKLKYTLINKEGKLAIIEQLGSMKFLLHEGFETEEEAEKWLDNYFSQKDKEMKEKADNFWKSLRGEI